MATVIYGTKVTSKNMGYFGNDEMCIGCGRTYKKAYMKYTSWFHIYYIPLVPYKTQYYRVCPICGANSDMDKNSAKNQIKRGASGFPGFEARAKHIMANKPKGLMATDNSYEIWLKDLSSGEDICVMQNCTKDDIKSFKFNRGYKKLPIEKVE